MLNATLLKRGIKANYKILLIFMAVLTLYSSMIVAMFDPALGESLNAMAQSMPQIFAAFGMLHAGVTLIDFMVNYLYGFLLVMFPLIFVILLASRLMTRYIDGGSMAYLLATPNRRRKIALTQAFVMALFILCLVIYVTLICMIVSGAMFPGELDVRKFMLLNIGLYGLLFFFGGLSFCAACIFNDARFSYGLGAGLPIAFILIEMLSQVGDKMEKLKYLTPLTLFDAYGIIGGKEDAVVSFLILYAGGILLFLCGIGAFCKKDLPI